MNKRGLLVGLGATLLCAPAIVRASSLMPVSPIPLRWRLGATPEQVAEHVRQQYRDLEKLGLVENSSELFNSILIVEDDPYDPYRVNVLLRQGVIPAADQLRIVTLLTDQNLV